MKILQDLSRVRFEIHLSNGKELGPTKLITLKSGENREIKLNTKNEKFEKLSVHAEVGSVEYGHDSEESHEGKGDGEHDSEKSEHNREDHSEHR